MKVLQIKFNRRVVGFVAPKTMTGQWQPKVEHTDQAEKYLTDEEKEMHDDAVAYVTYLKEESECAPCMRDVDICIEPIDISI